jgi:RNA polymerase sigma factor (sigma-70 family)
MPLERNAQNFLAVIESHKGIIYKIANSYCRDEENKKDLVQEIILQLWLAFNKYNEEYKLSTWIYRIALNVSISFSRKETRRHGINQPIPGDLLQLQEDHGPPGLHKEVEQLHLFIKSLKEIDRAIIILYLEQNPQQEIAHILGLSATNVSTRVSRIRQQLKKYFQTLKDH